MISTSDFKRGGRILMDKDPFTIEDYSVHTPSARGAATLVRARLRNILTGTLVEKTFEAGEKFNVPDVSFRQAQFLYDDGESCHFMDVSSYEQFSRDHGTLEDIRPWLSEGLQISSVTFDGRVVGVDLPQYVEGTVDLVGGGSRNDTAGGKNLKDALLTNGLTIKVPLFIENGETIVVNPRTLEFERRA